MNAARRLANVRAYSSILLFAVVVLVPWGVYGGYRHCLGLLPELALHSSREALLSFSISCSNGTRIAPNARPAGQCLLAWAAANM
jgi:hypothetical protein